MRINFVFNTANGEESFILRFNENDTVYQIIYSAYDFILPYCPEAVLIEYAQIA